MLAVGLAFDALHCRTWPRRHTPGLLNQSLAALNRRVRDLCILGGPIADRTGALDLVEHGEHTTVVGEVDERAADIGLTHELALLPRL
jgi:hypothetical protein